MIRNWALAAIFMISSVAYGEIKLPAIFGDHMVLQQGKPVPVWGRGAPGETITIRLIDQEVEATADADGKWMVQLNPLPAGGPHQMNLEGSSSITIQNILIGEVWLCSGQSNMEWQVQNATNAEEEIGNANRPEIRLFKITRQPHHEMQEELQGQWFVCSPETVKNFSAVGYFFGRELNDVLKAPVGLISSAWGGTPAEAWTPRPALQTIPEMAPVLERYEDTVSNQDERRRRFHEETASWEAQHHRKDTGISETVKNWAGVDVTADGWQPMELPQPWERAGLKIDGAVWFRRDVDIPAEWAGQPLVLQLGVVDDFDITFFNGNEVGKTDSATPNGVRAPRQYRIPGELVKAGRNVIAVRVFDRGDATGGFTGRPEAMQLALEQPGGQSLPLAGTWHYRVEKSFDQPDPLPPRPASPPFPNMPHSPGNLYNGMIYPLVPYAIKGVIWYQGESNVGRASQYQKLLTTMIQSWRDAWSKSAPPADPAQANFPFLIVQLANYMKPVDDPNKPSTWAQVREAQRQVTLTVPNTGLAVTIDIGEENDIHPRNKQEVGRRLALLAESIAYGRDIVFSGPTVTSVEREGEMIRIRLKHDAGRLVSKDEGYVRAFTVAGEDGKFYRAKAWIDRDSVMVRSEQVKNPIIARYNWADNPDGNLYNAAGLPAAPFEVRVDPLPTQPATMQQTTLPTTTPSM